MLKIKNIRDYRKYYKETVRDLPTRDENFIGNFFIDPDTKKKRFGWFEVYHGDKEGYGKAEAGIENFLQSFLDMARDGQAVYEFLQNAVDAGSTHFTMVWGVEETDGNHYLLVANNGDMFSFNSVRSILNVGSSTKSADSQTIGKFGIGFKLAHRLVGKDNGLQELLHENSGPVLFSWKNHELKQLAAGEAVEPQAIEFEATEDQQYTVIDEHPWLFKILITCFPCLPDNGFVEESVRLVKGGMGQDNPFSKQELAVLGSWVKKLLPALNVETYKEGSLFFIRLGKGKEADLADQNLREGVRFSLAVLNKTADKTKDRENVLSTVQLNDGEPITMPDLNYLKFGIDKEADLADYLYIRFGVRDLADLLRDQLEKFNREADIEVLIGFRDYDSIGDHFSGAPNFYLYFPLSEEVHNFNYILHCNAFYKGSSRTFLHKGSKGEEGINERLLSVIVSRLFLQLRAHAGSAAPADNRLFLDLYAALLTSGESINQERLWIKQPYLSPIREELKGVIPVADSGAVCGFSIAGPDDRVFIKATDIAIGNDWLEHPVKWFFWGTDFPQFRAQAEAKLELESYSVFSLLQNKDIYARVNAWLKEDGRRVEILLRELSVVVDNEIKTEIFAQNLGQLNMLEFSDGTVMSLQQLDERQEEGYLILHNKLSEIGDLLLKCGFKVSKVDFNGYRIVDQYQNRLSNKSQLRNHTTIVKLFSGFIRDELAAALTPAEKFRIFAAMRDLNSENRGDRIGELKLYRNKLGNIVCFKNLLLETDRTWLKGYRIDEMEYQQELRPYLLAKEEDVYEGVVYPFWQDIASALVIANGEQVLKEADELFALYKPADGVKKLLTEHGLVFFQDECVPVTNLFFSKGLSDITADDYPGISKALFDYYGLQIPDRFFLPFADLEVFKLAQSTPDLTPDAVDIPREKLALVLEFCRCTHYGFFDQLLISGGEQGFTTKGRGEMRQYFSANARLNTYTGTHYQADYLLLPDEFAGFQGLLELQNDTFAAKIIERYEEGELEPELDIIEALLTENILLRKAIFEKIRTMPLDTEWKDERQNKTYLSLVGGLLQYDPALLPAVDERLRLDKGDQQLELAVIDQANDSIGLKRGEKTIMLSQAEVLNLEDKASIRLVKDFAAECVSRSLLSEIQAGTIFKLSGAGVTDELVKKFLSGLTEKQLVNTHQLAFVLLSEKFKNEELKTFSVFAADGIDYELSGPWVLSGADPVCYNEKYILGSAYADLEKVIALGAGEPFKYSETDGDLLMPVYLFVNGADPVVFAEGVETVVLLDELLKCWKLTPSESLIKDQGQLNWQKFLGFAPGECIMHELALEEEQLPYIVGAWLQNRNTPLKTKLLQALGVSGPGSRVTRLRKWLQLPSSLEFNPDEIDFIGDGLLYNTLRLLCGEGEHPGFPMRFSAEDKRVQAWELIAGKLIGKGYEAFPVLTWCSDGLLVCKDPDDDTIYYLEDKFAASLQGQPELAGLYDRLPLAWLNNRYAAECIGMIEPLPFTEVLFTNGTAAEHTEPFYKRWKQEYTTALLRVPQVCSKVCVQIGEETYLAGIRKPETQYILSDTEEGLSIVYNQQLMLEQLLEQMTAREEKTEIIESVTALIKAKDTALAGFYHVMSMAGTPEGEASMYKALQKALEEENSRVERQDLLEEMDEAKVYSYQWFSAFLEYMLTYEQVASTTAQKSLNFQSIARFLNDGVPSEKYFMLYGAANLIPVNVDSFLNFSVSLIFKNRRKEMIKVDGVSARGQDMLIYCPSGLPADVLSNLEHVVNVSISFTPVLDLLRQLFLAFSNPDFISPWTDIREALPPLHFIYGPPGTGKTTTICRTLQDAFKEKFHVRCLILTPTNKASDVLVKKLLETETGIRAVRLGSATDPDLEALPEEVYQTSLGNEDINFYNIVASTVHRFPYFKVLGAPGPDRRLFQIDEHWDYVIIDEASMVSLPYLVFILMAFAGHQKLPKFIIAGDPMQIPPVLDLSDKELEDSDIADMNVYSMLGIKSFDPARQVLRPVDTIKNLDKQYRSVKEIGNLFSKISYGGKLLHGRDPAENPARQLPAPLASLFSSPVSFINFPLSNSHAIYEKRQLLFSSYHLYAGLLVAELINFFSKCEPQERWNIGVIAPYKAQALITNKLIRSVKISDKLNIICNTVHSFQGDQCDLVIFIVNPNNWQYTGHKKSLLSKEYIYNVAISRARDYLWILNPFNHLTNPHVNEIVDVNSSLNGKSKIHASGQIEKLLFGDTGYLEGYSFVTGHDNINIYGESEMRYFIRANEYAIDVQVTETGEPGLPGSKGRL